MTNSSTIERFAEDGFALEFVGVFSQNRAVSPHVHSVMELVYVMDGSCISKMESGVSTTFSAETGMCYVIPPHIRHDQKGRCSTVFINFSLAEAAYPEKMILLNTAGDRYLRRWFADLAEISRHGMSPESRPLAEAIWRRVRGFCDRTEKNDDGQRSLRLENCLIFISHHYRESLTAADIARHVKMSVTQVNTWFRQEFNLSLMQYVYQFRLKIARHLLSNDYLSIGEIADQCGFGSANYFIRAFRRCYGMTPGELRRMPSGEPGSDQEL